MHSDIGGGHKNYHLEKNAQGLEVPVMGGLVETVTDTVEFIDKLIEGGWHSAASKRIVKIAVMHSYGAPHYNPNQYHYEERATVTRNVRNEYRYIPLGIMIDLAKRYGEIIFDDKLQNSDNSVKSSVGSGCTPL